MSESGFRFITEENIGIGTLKLFMKSPSSPSSSSASRTSCAFPGDVVVGRLSLTLERTSYVRGVWVKLSVCSSVKGRDSKQTPQTIDHLEAEDDYASGGLYHVLLGICSDFTDVTSLDIREQAHRERQRQIAAACEFVELTGG